ncbi:MAG: hypothetical protein R6U98_37470, partial [Pirellulaceae bacterium]
MESGPTQAALPLVGLPADKVIRDRYLSGGWIPPVGKLPGASRPPVGRTRGRQSHPRPASFRRLDFSGFETHPAQAVLPLVGLAADKSPATGIKREGLHGTYRF